MEWLLGCYEENLGETWEIVQKCCWYYDWNPFSPWHF